MKLTDTQLRLLIAISVFFGDGRHARESLPRPSPTKNSVKFRPSVRVRAGLANQLSTPFTVLLAWPFLGERPSTRVVIGVALAFGGVALTVAEPRASVKIVPPERPGGTGDNDVNQSQ